MKNPFKNLDKTTIIAIYAFLGAVVLVMIMFLPKFGYMSTAKAVDYGAYGIVLYTVLLSVLTFIIKPYPWGKYEYNKILGSIIKPEFQEINSLIQEKKVEIVPIHVKYDYNISNYINLQDEAYRKRLMQGAKLNAKDELKIKLCNDLLESGLIKVIETESSDRLLTEWKLNVIPYGKEV